MKRYVPLILLIGIYAGYATALLAQPVIPGSAAPVIGDVIPLIPAQTAGVEPGSDGANRTWDFSGLQRDENFPGDPFFRFTAVDEAPEAQEFPDADFASLNFDSSWAFFRYDQGVIFRLGGVIRVNDSTTAVQIEEEPEVDFWYPTEFNGERGGLFNGRNKVTFTHSGTIENEFRGEKNNIIDSYGTLILPNGTFDDVIRLKAERRQEDLFNGAPVNTTIETVWSWYSPRYKFWLLRILEQDNGHKDVFYAADLLPVSVGDDNHNAQNHSLSVWPNPASAEAKVGFSVTNVSLCGITIYTAQGISVATVPESLLTPGKYSRSIDISGLAPGAYFVRITIGSHTATQQFIIL